MRKCFINSAVTISAQNTFEAEDLLENVTTKFARAIHPDYKKRISPAAARRMATGVKMGVVAARECLNRAAVVEPDAVIMGSGLGCIEDTEKFLNTIITNKEEFISPSAFIESTHNTIGARIALGMKCKAYNTTYVHGSASFESALIDAQLMIGLEEKQQVLVGGVDELGNEFIEYVNMLEEKEKKGINVPFGEGASFFLISSERVPGSVQLVDVELKEKISEENITEYAVTFLKRNKLDLTDIDLLITGSNGDAYDRFYNTLVHNSFSEIPHIKYKQLSGEHYTASGFGCWLGYEIIIRNRIPEVLLDTQTPPDLPVQNVLLYHQFKGKNHSFILLSSC
jgi:3-oxoacyl-[acyl-carrier-protein] synthase II